MISHLYHNLYACPGGVSRHQNNLNFENISNRSDVGNSKIYQMYYGWGGEGANLNVPDFLVFLVKLCLGRVSKTARGARFSIFSIFIFVGEKIGYWIFMEGGGGFGSFLFKFMGVMKTLTKKIPKNGLKWQQKCHT